MLFPLGQMVLQHFRDGQAVGTPLMAFAAFDAVLYRLHGHGRKGGGYGWRDTVGDHRIDHGGGDHDALRAGLAVFTAAAEPLPQLLAALLHGLPVLGRNHVLPAVEGDHLIDSGHRVKAGDRNDIGPLPQEPEA